MPRPLDPDTKGITLNLLAIVHQVFMTPWKNQGTNRCYCFWYLEWLDPKGFTGIKIPITMNVNLLFMFFKFLLFLICWVCNKGGHCWVSEFIWSRLSFEGALFSKPKAQAMPHQSNHIVMNGLQRTAVSRKELWKKRKQKGFLIIFAQQSHIPL